MKKKYRNKLCFALLLALNFVVFFTTSCCSKSFLSEINKKEETDINFIDNTEVNNQINHKQQFIDTSKKESIVTYFGLKMVPYLSGNDTIYLPFSYPKTMEEIRDISIKETLDITAIQKIVRNAIELNYSTKLDEVSKIIDKTIDRSLLTQVVLILFCIVITLIVIFKK